METKNREKLLLIAVGVMAGFWLLNLVVISPLIDSWHSRSKEIAKLKTDIENGGMLVRRGPDIRDRWDAMRANALPNNPTVAERQLFTAFSGWVSSGGVTPGSFRPQLQEGDSNYTTVDCRSDITGGPNGVLDFLRSMTKDPLADKVDSFEMSAKDDNGRQLALTLGMSGLILTDSDPSSFTPAPKPAETPSSTDTNSDPFHIIARNNIFDQSRRPERPDRPVVRAPIVSTLAETGTAADNGQGSAWFTGDGVSSTKEYKVGEAVGNFKLTAVDVAHNTVTLTNGSNTFNLDPNSSLRSENDGPWKIAGYVAPEPTTNTNATASASGATNPAAGSTEDDVIARLKKRRESE